MDNSYIPQALPEASLPEGDTSVEEAATPKPDPQSIEGLRAVFAKREALEYPDIVVPAKSLRLTEAGTLAVPELGGTFAFNEWSKNQLASFVGVRWNRWFEQMNGGEQAEEVNKRLWSRSLMLKVRTSRSGSPNGVTGVVNALVSQTFSPLPDTQVLDLLSDALRPVEPALTILRHYVTSKTTGYVLGIGTPFRPGDDKEVGDIWGCISIRNSGVGYAAACLIASLERLLCKNGMRAPIPDAVLFRRAHRSFDLRKLRDLLTKSLRGLPGKFANAGRALLASRRRPVDDATAAFLEILRAARLPRKLLPELERAYDAELALKGTAFGVSQAATRAAQTLPSEERFELERAAGEYLERSNAEHL